MGLHRKSIFSIIGLAGVADDERPKAKAWGRGFEAPMLLLALWIMIEWYLVAKGYYPQRWEVTTNWIVWLLFVSETAILTFLVRDKKRYLLGNWINLLIIAIGLPILWNHSAYTAMLRSLRILLLFRILVEISSTLRQVLARNNIGLTLLVSLLIVVMAGTSMAVIDHGIETPWDGIWWAWVTVTTVGYGDVVPESPEGKIFGGLLMILGLGLFSLITASFSAFLISREEEELIEKEKEVVSAEHEAIDRLEMIEKRMENLEAGLDRLFDQLIEKRDRPDLDEEEKK